MRNTNRYGNGGDYPACYKDPAVTDAEHLVRAAYHMIEAGYGDEALGVVAKIAEAFADVPVNPKLKPPAKALGDVRYLPCGILKYHDNGIECCVPAPAYSAGNDEEKADQENKSRTMRAAEKIRDSRLGWFSGKQASAALAGRLPNTSSFRPATMLKKIMAICANYDPAMPREAAVLLADKLKYVLDRNPLGHDKWTSLHRNLADADTGYHRADDPGMTFFYLSEQQAAMAGRILEQDGRGQGGSLYDLSESAVKWRECSRPAMDDAFAVLHANNKKDYGGIPFLERKHAKEHFVPEPGQPMQYFYGTDEYFLSDRLYDALYALRDVNNLMRCHQALYRHPDEYLHGLLGKCKIAVTDVSEALPPDLHITAAKLMAARVWAPIEKHRHQADPELCAQAESAFAIALERSCTEERLDSPLFHPVPEENPAGAPDKNERSCDE